MQQQSDTSTSAMIVVKLEEQDSVKSFDCGDDDLNDFILHESPHEPTRLLYFDLNDLDED